MEPVIPFVLAGLAVLLAWVAPGLMARQKPLPACPAGRPGGVAGGVGRRHPGRARGRARDRPAAARRRGPGGAPAARRARPCWSAPSSSGGCCRPGTTSAPGCGGCAPTTASSSTSSRGTSERVRILQHPTPTAYCIPGRQSRVVLSQGVLDALPEDQLEAVIAHEDAHLRGRHDLLLEFFSVVHRGRPGAAAVTGGARRGAPARRGAGRPGRGAAQRRGRDGPRPARRSRAAANRRPPSASAPRRRCGCGCSPTARPTRRCRSLAYTLRRGRRDPARCSCWRWPGHERRPDARAARPDGRGAHLPR